MSLHTEFQVHIMFLTLDIDPTTPDIKICTAHHKITQPRQHKKFCLLVSDECVSKFHLPTVFSS